MEKSQKQLTRMQMLQQIKRIFFHRYLWQGKILKVFLSLIAGIIISVGITKCLIASEAPALTYKTSWIGNTFNGDSKWVQMQVSGIFVAADGTVYTNSPWDEAGREVGIYKNGDAIGKAEDLHGWERFGGSAVTVDKKYIYVAMGQNFVDNKEDYPPKGTTWYCVRRYNLSGKTAPFAEGRGWDKSMLIVSKKSQVTGLATANGELYVSDKAANKIRVYSTSSFGKELRSFSVSNPDKMTVDQKGNLWIIQSKNNSTPAQIVHYSKQGKQLPEKITDVANPTAIAVDNQGRLLVADNSPRQQILIYKTASKPVQVATFGTKGGIYAGTPGEVGNLKFYGITGVGSDAAGNIYISNDGFNHTGVDLRKFSSSGALQWRLLGLHFLDNADADPATDGVNLYSKDEHFVMDYSKPAGKQWTYKGYTLNAFKYPQDPRLHVGGDAPMFRRIRGKSFMFISNMYTSYLQIYRFNPATDGEIAIPSGMFVGTNVDNKPAFDGKWPPNQPTPGEWIWRDNNGNGGFDKNEYASSKDYPFIGGWWVDSKGDVWRTLRSQDGVGIRHYPCQGLDAKGNPIYSYTSMKKQTTPSMFTDLRRIEYFPETDTMYLSGYTKDHPAINSDYAKLIGSEIARFDNWSKGNRTPRWRIVLPTDTKAPPEVLTPAAMSVAGKYIFVAAVKTTEVYVYNTATGAQVKVLKPGPEVAGEIGWVDIPYGIRAFRRSNGDYLVFLEEVLKAKVMMYQFKG